MMPTHLPLTCLFALTGVASFVALTACDKTNSVSDNDTTNNVTNNYITQAVGPAGAVLSIEGAVLRIPAGALPGEVEIRMGIGAEPPAPVPEGEATAVFELTPHGQLFAAPVVLELPSPGPDAVVYRVEEGGGAWEALDTTAPNGAPRVEVDTFSYFVAVAAVSGESDAGGGDAEVAGRGPSLPATCSDDLSGASDPESGTPCSNTQVPSGDEVSSAMSQLYAQCQAEAGGACMRCLVGRGCSGDDASATYVYILQEVCRNAESLCGPACAGFVCPPEP
jgi:hypothetical protein